MCVVHLSGQGGEYRPGRAADVHKTMGCTQLSGFPCEQGELAQVVSEPIFDIPGLVEAERHQRFDPILGGWSPERSYASIPPGVPGSRNAG
jgi:hypothetical protein